MTPGADDAQVAHELDLLARAAKGEGEPFDRFFDRHAPAVQLLVERLLGPGPEADNVVLEAFQKTVRRLPLLGARNSSPRIYVLTTARNGAYAALGRERAAPADPAVAALLTLPSRQRELLALRELGLSEGECAEIAGVSAGDVGEQVARARLRLSDALDGGSLSGVFADPRAERLLAAEVVRQEGASLPPEVDAEITALAEHDVRFAAALSAVRSPSRSVGQLPPATGQARLSAVAREIAVGAAAAAGAAAVTPPPAAAAPTPAPAPPRPASDPYDAEIGDEASWGIVEDFDEEPGSPPIAPAPAPREETDAAPKDSAWQPDPAGPAPEQPAPPAAPEPQAAASSDDPLDGWDEVDWEDDDRSWTAGGADPAAGAPLSAAIPALGGETRPFDVVGAGLADPEPTLPAVDGEDPDLLGPDYAELPPGGELPPRSPWRFLVWFLALALLIGGVALAIYVVGKDQAGSSPTSTIEQVAPSSTTPKRTTPKATTPKRTTPKATTPKATTPKRSSSTSSSGGSSSSTRSTSTSSSGSSTGSSTSGGSSGSSTKVSSGSSSSGGSVRGAGSTTP